MKGCSDQCAARIRLIQQAGVSNCLAMAQTMGRKDPAADLYAIRKAALFGFKEAGRQIGRSGTFVRRIVEKYAEYAALILREQAEKRGQKHG